MGSTYSPLKHVAASFLIVRSRVIIRTCVYTRVRVRPRSDLGTRLDPIASLNFAFRCKSAEISNFSTRKNSHPPIGNDSTILCGFEWFMGFTHERKLINHEARVQPSGYQLRVIQVACTM